MQKQRGSNKFNFPSKNLKSGEILVVETTQVKGIIFSDNINGKVCTVNVFI